MMASSLNRTPFKNLTRGCSVSAWVYMNCLRKYHPSENQLESAEPFKEVCQIMMHSPKLVLENTLDGIGVGISPDLVEKVIEKFENAGMQAYRFFRWAEKQRDYTHSVKAYHLMIDSLAKVRQYKLMWGLVNDMRGKGVLNIETFCVMIRRYARAQKVNEAIYTFNVMEKFGVTPNLAAFNSFLGAFCKSKNVKKAQEIFDSMKDRFVPDSKTYSILLEGWGREPNLPKARKVYREMIEEGCYPDIVTYSILVDLLCKARCIREAMEVIGEMRNRNCIPNSYIYSILIHTYGSEKLIADAVDAFLEMERNGIVADVAAYNALVGAFCKAKRFQNVSRVLGEMAKKNVSPNSRTLNIILNGLIDSREFDEAFKFFRKMIKCCDPDSDTYTMLIKMFCSTGRLEKALKVWKYMGIKQFVASMHTSSVLINELCEKGELNMACILMEEMIEKGIRPSGQTFRRLKKLLLQEGREDVLELLLEKMKLLIKEPLND